MDLEDEVFEQIYKEKNVLVVAAAGNSANTAYSYPASYDSVMSVAALNPNLEVAYFSQKNDQGMSLIQKFCSDFTFCFRILNHS